MALLFTLNTVKKILLLISACRRSAYPIAPASILTRLLQLLDQISPLLGVMTPTMSTMKPINQNNKNSRKAAQRIVLAFLSCTNASLQALNPQKLHRLLLFFYLHFCLCPYTNVIKCITFLLSTPQILTFPPRAASLLIKILILNHILPPYLPIKDKSPTTHRRHMLSFLKVVSKILRNLRILHPPQLPSLPFPTNKII